MLSLLSNGDTWVYIFHIVVFVFAALILAQKTLLGTYHHLFLMNLELRWKRYEHHNLLIHYLGFSTFDFCKITLIFMHSNFFFLWFLWFLDPQCWPLFLSALAFNVFATMFFLKTNWQHIRESIVYLIERIIHNQCAHFLTLVLFRFQQCVASHLWLIFVHEPNQELMIKYGPWMTCDTFQTLPTLSLRLGFQ